MFQTRIIDSYQLQTYEAVMSAVNQFCGSHDIVSVKNDVKKDDVIYSIVYRIPQKNKDDLKNSPAAPVQQLKSAISLLEESEAVFVAKQKETGFLCPADCQCIKCRIIEFLAETADI